MKNNFFTLRPWQRKIKQLVLYGLSSIFLYLTGGQRKSTQILKSYHNRYLGKRCFIIGNGPSLKKEDLEKLANDISFASNRIYKMYDEIDWHPTFYCMFDESVAKSEGVIEGANSTICEMKFFRSQGYYIYRHINEPKCYVHSWYSRKYLDNPMFSEDLSKGVYSIATVTYMMIQLAVYMGFKEIYLIGVVHNYANTQLKDGTVIHNTGVKSYFGDHGKAEKNACGATWEMDVAYEYAEKYSRGHNFRIYNATRGGKLEVFERIDFDTLF